MEIFQKLEKALTVCVQPQESQCGGTIYIKSHSGTLGFKGALVNDAGKILRARYDSSDQKLLAGLGGGRTCFGKAGSSSHGLARRAQSGQFRNAFASLWAGSQCEASVFGPFPPKLHKTTNFRWAVICV